MRYIAPGGTPISIGDIARSFFEAVTIDGAIERFSQEVSKAFGAKHCLFLSTGRAAMCELLGSLARLKGDAKNEVILPTYTCFSVPSSVAKAGLKIRLCDVDPRTLDYDLQKLSKIDFRNVLGIVTSNLYGIPNDLEQIGRIADAKDIYLIDDCAQCMGGQVAGKFSGTMGIAGLFSLDKGKNITSMDGGILITNSDELASCIGANIRDLPGSTVAERLMYIAKLCFYSVFLRPNLYWFPRLLPFLKLGRTFYTTDYPIGSYDAHRAAVGLRLFQRLGHITAARVKNAEYLIEQLSGMPLLETPRFKDYVTPVYLRFPVLLGHAELRKKIVEELNRAGIGATTSYPSPINEIHEIQNIIVNENCDFPGGKQVAEQIVTLPTHPFVEEEDLSKTVAVIARCINAVVAADSSRNQSIQ